MPRYLPNMRFADCWSSIGNITFFHIDGRCYWRTRPRPVFPGTPGQLLQLDIHRRALAAWRTISSTEQHQWNTYAKAVPSHRPPYDNNHHITGHNLFVSAYHGFALLGNEHVPVPQQYPVFPVASVNTVTATVVNGTDLQLDCTIVMKTETLSSRYRVAARIQLANIGEGKNSGLMRSFLSETLELQTYQDGTETGMAAMIIRFLIHEYQDIWNVEGSSLNMYSKFFLIDQTTGYRKLFRSKPEVLSI